MMKDQGDEEIRCAHPRHNEADKTAESPEEHLQIPVSFAGHPERFSETEHDARRPEQEEWGEDIEEYAIETSHEILLPNIRKGRSNVSNSLLLCSAALALQFFP